MQPNLKILVVDDDPTMKGVLASLLAKMNHNYSQIIYCDTYRDGIEMIAEYDFSIAILDQDLTDKNNDEFGKGSNLAIRLKDKSPFCQIIYITSWLAKAEFQDDISLTKYFQLVQKPVGEFTFPRIVDSAIANYRKTKTEFLGGLLLKPISEAPFRIKSHDEIYRVETVKNEKCCTIFMLKDDILLPITVRGTLDLVQQKIQDWLGSKHQIIRVNASHLVNIYYVIDSSYKSVHLRVEDSTIKDTVPVGRRFVSNLSLLKE